MGLSSIRQVDRYPPARQGHSSPETTAPFPASASVHGYSSSHSLTQSNDEFPNTVYHLHNNASSIVAVYWVTALIQGL
jgi:hypothetical protein